MSTLATLDTTGFLAPRADQARVQRQPKAATVSAPTYIGEPINYELHMATARRIRAQAMADSLSHLRGWFKR